jgi:hypothetical protein
MDKIKARTTQSGQLKNLLKEVGGEQLIAMLLSLSSVSLIDLTTTHARTNL